MSIFMSSGRKGRTMGRVAWLVGLLAVLAVDALAQRDLATEFEAIPDWPEEGFVPEGWNDRYVFLDRNAKQMVLAYPVDLAEGKRAETPGRFRIERFDLTNQVDASISADVERSGSRFTYSYVVSNSARAKNSITSVLMPVPSFGDGDSITGPALWGAAPSPSRIAALQRAIGRPHGVFLSWYANDPTSVDDPDASTIRPRGKLDGLRVTSGLKPGVTLAYVRGGSYPALRKDMPEAVLRQTDPIMQIEFSSQNVVTIGPKFDADSPKVEIAADFHRGLGLMIEAGQLDRRSAAVRRARWGLERCLRTAEDPGDGSASVCDLGSAFDLRPRSDLEAGVIHAMRLSLAD